MKVNFVIQIRMVNFTPKKQFSLYKIGLSDMKVKLCYLIQDGKIHPKTTKLILDPYTQNVRKKSLHNCVILF